MVINLEQDDEIIRTTASNRNLDMETETCTTGSA